MSLVPVESYSLICDRCGDTYEEGDYTIFGPGWDPRDNAGDGDWWIGTMGRFDADDKRGPEDRDLCPGCYTREWVDDDTVEEFTELPLPAEHAMVRNPRFTGSVAAPFEWCKAEGCHLQAKNEVHK